MGLTLGDRTESFRNSLIAASGPLKTMDDEVTSIMGPDGTASKINKGFSGAMSIFSEALMASNAAHTILGKLLQNAKQNMQAVLA